jgi:hypothetical protein
VVHGEFLDPEFHHPALGAQHRHRQRRSGSGGQQQLRPSGKLGGKLSHYIQAHLVLQQLQVIEDQGHRSGHGRHRRGQPGHHANDRGPGPASPRTILEAIGSTRSRATAR